MLALGIGEHLRIEVALRNVTGLSLQKLVVGVTRETSETIGQVILYICRCWARAMVVNVLNMGAKSAVQSTRLNRRHGRRGEVVPRGVAGRVLDRGMIKRGAVPAVEV